ncbi:MAG: substrate-binding domain-containing protein [Thermoleophilia bacterium]|nr:substrate-binding domain-containing protein [Thermoleophilia bacterium]
MRSRLSIEGRRRRAAALAPVALAAVLVVAALATSAFAGPEKGAGQQQYTIGVSNTLVGNGWREGMICSIKAQALKSGQVSSLRIAHRQTDTAGQIADIRSLISAGVNAIIINPSSPTALKPIAAQARARGIQVVFIDQYVNAPGAYNATNDQVAYGRLGAEWLFKKLKGRGNVVEMRGIAGVPADTDRHKGFQQALRKYRNIRVVKSVFTGWQFAPGGKQMLDLLNSGQRVNGVWTSGIDYTVVNAFRTARKPYVPVVGADNFGFIRQVKSRYPRFQGAAVTNPSSIGGVGVTVALRALNKQSVPRWVKLKPDIWTWPADKAKINRYASPRAPADGSAQIQINPWTTYSLSQYRACKGP